MASCSPGFSLLPNMLSTYTTQPNHRKILDFIFQRKKNMCKMLKELYEACLINKDNTGGNFTG
jgi:hypothetical protein